jgi:undecaprenyl-diphosphatase
MIDFLYSIDLSILYFFNHTLSSSILDKFFMLITNVKNWYLAYAILLGISFFKGGARGKLALVGVLLLIVITDQLSHKILKEIFLRERPCIALSDVLMPAGCNGTYSFPSNHAFNNFAAATFFFFLFKNLKYPLFVTAFLVSVSRIYLGLHYPSDILAGMLLGICFGYVFAKGVLKVEALIIKNKSSGR